MDYDEFRRLWHEALARAGLVSVPFRPTETVDLQHMDRAYKVYMPMSHGNQTGPFHVTVELSWRWSALQSARTATTEEDLLVTLLGEDGYEADTERPWVRVDVNLHATLPDGDPTPMPDAAVWQHWMEKVTHEMGLLELPNLPEVRWDRGQVPLFWQGDPAARLQCRPDGQLYLTGVELPAWQGIELPRQWDDPERPEDGDTEVQLDSFCEWVRDSLEVWEGNLQHLVAG
jgi:hypothetical protein